jgi:GNAT superfamily N-acetyltransferase
MADGANRLTRPKPSTFDNRVPLPTYRVACKPLTPDLIEDYLRFFELRAFTDNPRWAGCYCYFPLHDPQKTPWKLRSGADNRRDVRACVAARAAHGYLAYHGSEVIGWCNAGPWSLYPMLRDEHEPDSATLGVIFCFVVAPEWRRRKVATGLLDAACEGLHALGMTEVQAKPRKTGTDAADNHLGPLAMYLAAGFEVVRDGDDDDVYVRKTLG